MTECLVSEPNDSSSCDKPQKEREKKKSHIWHSVTKSGLRDNRAAPQVVYTKEYMRCKMPQRYPYLNDKMRFSL